MNALEPINKHPLVWILTDLFGISVGEISRRSKITRPRLARLNQLAPPSPSETLSLQTLVKSSLRALETTPHPPYYKRPPFLDDYYTHVIQVIRRYIALHDAPSPKPRRTELTDLILANVHTDGTRETAVFAQLQHSFSIRAIREAAERIGIRRLARGPQFYWYPPPLTTPPLPSTTTNSPLFDRPITPPRTERQRKCRHHILRCLEKAPDNMLPYKEILALVAPLKFSHQLIRSSIYELTLIVETSGFGPKKRTMVALPHKYRTSTP